MTYQEQQKQWEAKQAEIDAVNKKLGKLTADIAIANADIKRFSGYECPEPFLSLAMKSKAKLEAKEAELKERLGRLNV